MDFHASRLYVIFERSKITIFAFKLYSTIVLLGDKDKSMSFCVQTVMYSQLMEYTNLPNN